MSRISHALATAEEILPPEPIDETTTGPALTAHLRELAGLSRIEYDRRRKTSAKQLGIAPATLDGEVAALRPGESAAEDDFGWSIDPAADEVDAAALLSDLSTEYTARVILPAHAADALALWTLHTYTHRSARASPLLVFRSPEKRCGKTSAMAAVASLVDKPMPGSNITAAALFRSIEKWEPCLLIDEADTFLGENDELRGVINSGHTRTSAYVIRTVGDNHDPTRFSTWCPKAIAVIGALHGTLADRAIIVSMRRKRPDEIVASVTNADGPRILALKQRCARWAADNGDAFSDATPQRPAGLNDRAFDNWTHLLAIAEAAGGEWPERARVAAFAMSGEDTDADSAGSLLLGDIRGIFRETALDYIATTDLKSRLGDMQHRPWPEWKQGKPITERQIAGLLGKFSIRPEQIWREGRNFRGYAAPDFADAFARYLAPEKSPPSNPGALSASPLEAAETQGVLRDGYPLGKDGSSGSEPLETLGGEPVLAPSGYENDDFGQPDDSLASEPSWHEGRL